MAKAAGSVYKDFLQEEWEERLYCRSVKRNYVLKTIQMPHVLQYVMYVEKELVNSTIQQKGETPSLGTLLRIDNCFRFDGKTVCAELLSKAFHFSRTLHGSMKAPFGHLA